MGRKSREKKQRRNRDAALDAKLLANYTTDSLLDLLEVGSVSPTGAHRGPTIAVLFAAAVERRSTGSVTAGPDALVDLVRRAARASPYLSHLEDFQPYDGRAVVHVRWGPELFRVVPGSLERPTATINQHHLLASAIDPILVPRLGFGLFDVGDLILRRLDHVAKVLGVYWPDGPAAEIHADAHVTQSELDGAVDLLTMEDILGACAHPERAAIAARRYTVGAAKLKCDPSDSISTFQTAIGVRAPRGTVMIPAGFLMESLNAIAVELAAEAFALDPSSRDVYASKAATRVARLFQGLGLSIGGPVRLGASRGIHSVVQFNSRQFLALDVATGLTPGELQLSLDRGGATLPAIEPGTTLRVGAGEWSVPEDAQVARVQIAASPPHGKPYGLMGPCLHLEDLEWILHSSMRCPSDLWFFVRDLENPDGMDRMLAWDMIDRWEIWQAEKSFFRGGVSLDMLVFEPHAAVAEWDEAARAADLEHALHALGQPPLRDWPVVDFDHLNGVEVGSMRTDTMLIVLPWTVPIVIHKTDPTCPHEQFSVLWNLAQGIAWKFDHTQDAFADAARRSGLSSLQIRFEFRDRATGELLTPRVDSDGLLTVGWDGRLEGALQEDSFAVEARCGEVLAFSLGPDHREGFLSAWNAAPAGVRLDPFWVRQHAQELPEPLKGHGSFRSVSLHRLGEHLVATGVKPGVLERDAASKFETDVVFPWLVKRFHSTIERFSGETLLAYALAQLECVHHHRFILEKRAAWQQAFGNASASAVLDRRSGMSLATRVVSFMVEEILARPPTGSADPDELAWTEIYAVAELCIESCFRSDAIHRRLRATSVEVTDLFEVNVLETDDPTDVDLSRYNAARAKATLPPPVPIGEHDEAPDAASRPSRVSGRLPEVREIDAALLATLGFGLDAIIELLGVATAWAPAAPDSATRTSAASIIEKCPVAEEGPTEDEYVAALKWLTLSGLDLATETIPHWETEKRSHRVMTKPFIDAAPDVWVLPWTAETTLRVLGIYLADGRLPWPASELPDQVNLALTKCRQRRNRQLEKECVHLLADVGLVVRGKLTGKKALKLGVPDLTGEIDALCVDSARSRIWVIEAKDPYVPYSARQIRRSVQQFHEPDGYVATLLRKAAIIEQHCIELASHLKVDDPTREWQVLALVVTRRVEAAAFATAPVVPFCTIESLVHTMGSDLAPLAGWPESMPQTM